MEIKVLGCSGGKSPDLDLTSYLIDDAILIDTGAVSCTLSLEEQETITDILITHSHLDHILGLAFLIDNTHSARARPLSVYAAEPTLAVIREHLLAPEIVPFAAEEIDRGLVHFHPVKMEVPFNLGRYEVEAFPVFHMAGSVAFRVSDEDHTMVFTGDTGRTDRIWQWIAQRGGVDCLIAEASFPERMEALAKISRHLTPASLVTSLQKADLDRSRPVHVVHLKPAFMEEMVAELEAKIGWDLIPLQKGDVIKLAKGEPEAGPDELAEKMKDKEVAFDREDDLYHQRDRLFKDFGLVMNAGEVLFRQGENSKVMYIIQEGRVRIYRTVEGRDKTLSVIGPGDFFGEMAMFNNRPRSASALALTDLRLLAFNKAAFEKLIAKNFGIALHVIRTLSARMQETDGIIETLLYPDTESKVINTLIQAAIDEGIESSEGWLVRTSPEKLAEKSGVILPSLREILARLVGRNVIALRREAVIIPDLAKLRRFLKYLEFQDEFGRPE
jgi:CRP-like cAMP-binding protein/ribonuclease BN (tRNA processing enzyme)